MNTAEQAKIWEKNFDKKAAKIRAGRILSQIKKYNPKAHKVLELGVGLGFVLPHFNKFQTSGLDLQKEYVNIARKRLVKSKLYIQNMNNFKINDKFDVIFSVHECINEVKPFKNWENVFKNVNKHLNSNGLLVFDMRVQKYLDEKAKESVKLKETPSGFIYDNTIVQGSKLIWDTTYFKKIGRDTYKIEKDKYYEEIYSIPKVKKVLLKYFSIIKIIKFENNQKVLFVCRKR